MSVIEVNKFSCICDDVSVILKLIKSLGSWTVTSGAASGSWIKSSWAIESSLAAVNLYGLYPFFSTFVVADDRNSSVNILSVSFTDALVFSSEFF